MLALIGIIIVICLYGARYMPRANNYPVLKGPQEVDPLPSSSMEAEREKVLKQIDDNARKGKFRKNWQVQWDKFYWDIW